MGDHPIITLQIGHYSNYIGAHFWNIQDSLVYGTSNQELNHDVLFREGLTPTSRQVTYLPRLINVDLKGSLGLLPEFGDLYDNGGILGLSKSQLASDYSLWQGDVAVQKEESKPKNNFLRGLEREEKNLTIVDEDKDVCETSTSATESSDVTEDEIQVWSDYLRMRYHPKTNFILNEFQHLNPTRPFDIFGIGVDEAKSTQDDFEDRIRFFVEECDFLDGFQILVDGDGGFTGYGSEVARFLSDEFPSKCRNFFPTYPGHISAEPILNLTRFLNSSLGIRSLCNDSTLVTPMSMASDAFPLRNSFRSLPDIKYNPESMYQTASILAGAFETLSLPWRMKHARHRMIDICTGFNPYGRKLAGLACVMPFPGFVDNQFSSVAETLMEPPLSGNPFELSSLTPSVLFDRSELWLEAMSVRGLERHLKPINFNLTDSTWQKKYSSNIYLRTDTLNQALLCYYNQHWPQTKMGLTSAEAGLPVGTPFPKIFNPNSGDATTTQTTTTVMTSWQSSKAVGNLPSKMCDRLERINLNKLHRFGEAGLEQDELKEVIEDLNTLAKCYDPDPFEL